MHSTPYWIPPWSTTVLLGEFTRLSWVRVLATAGVCHRCMGGTSGPRYRRGVFAATPAGARYGFRLKVPPPQKREELVAPGHSDRDRCPVATRVPRRVLRPLPGLHLHAHPPPRHVRDPQHLQRALQLRQFLMAFVCVLTGVIDCVIGGVNVCVLAYPDTDRVRDGFHGDCWCDCAAPPPAPACATASSSAARRRLRLRAHRRH